jgi:tetratricopeptide (TPR) repeat protein
MRMHLRTVIAALLTLLVARAPAHGSAADEAHAKQLYFDGRKAYEIGDYQTAYAAFKESFQLSHHAALLYNIASALQGLRRPHEAAEALRSFLRLQPTDPDRDKIEERILTLEEEQRLLDNEKLAAERKLVSPPPAVVAPPPPPTTILVPVFREPPLGRRKKIGIAVGVVGGTLVLAGVAVVLAIVLTPSKIDPPYTPASIGPMPGTR